jgi:hypothetical protein
MTSNEPSVRPINPYSIFIEDVVRDDLDIPQMRDPERIPSLEVHFKTYTDERTPDIETARTKVYITGWEWKKDHPIPRRA